MTVFHNRGNLERSNASFTDGFVTEYNKLHPSTAMEWIDYGLGGLSAGTISLAPSDATDLADLYTLLAKRNLLCGYEATERFYEIGTAESLREADRFFRQRISNKYASFSSSSDRTE